MHDKTLGELIEMAAGGDQRASAELVQRYEGSLRASIRSGLGNDLRARLSASDVFQATIVAAMADLEKLDFQGEPAFVAWLHKIAERQLLMAARFHSANKRDVSRERFAGTTPGHPAADPSPSTAAVQGEMTELIQSAVKKLEGMERRVVELHSFEGHSFGKVAEELGISGAARARYIFQRALKSLGRTLDDLG